MNRKGKVAFVTIFHVPNYGSVLQAYATQCLLIKLGYDCNLINYKYPNEWHIEQDPKRKPSFKSKILPFLGLKSEHRKRKKLQNFRKNHFHFTKEYKDLQSLVKENWSSYDSFISGSDQLWNSRFTLADSAFMLSFVPDDKKRISLASSFSSDTIPSEYRQKYYTSLSKYSHLSVREENGKRIIEDELHIKKAVKVLPDPTLLITREEWLSKFPLRKGSQEKYILLYLLTYAFESRPYVFEVINYFKEKYGYKVIALEGYTKPKNALGIVMEDRTDAGIENYMTLFAKAQLVITTSFHGTAFAANFGIPLISITPQNGDDRQSSLLQRLGLEQCIIPVGTDIKCINPFYDIQAANEKLNELRTESIHWITKALSK